MCKHPAPKKSAKSNRHPTVERVHRHHVKSDSLDPTHFEQVDPKAQSAETTVEKTQDEISASIPEAKKSRFHVFTRLLPKSRESTAKGSCEAVRTGVKVPEGQTQAVAATTVKAPSAEIVSHTVDPKGVGGAVKPEVRGVSQTQVPDSDKKPVIAYAHRKIDSKKSRHDPQYQTLYSLNNEWESDADGFSAYANVVDTTQVSTAKLSAETDKTQTTVTNSAEPVH